MVNVDELGLNFDKGNGLIAAIMQDAKTNEILMQAFMNKEALQKTLETGKVWYYSRSRNKLWMKGGLSGNVQTVKEIFIDCDNDSILLKVEQKGGACHEGYRSCFYRKLENGKFVKICKQVFEPEKVYGKGKK